MPIILQHEHPSWAEDHDQWRIIDHLSHRIGNDRVRQVDIVTAWMGGPQLLDRLRPALMAVIERHTEARPTRIRVIVGNQPEGSRMTPESTFERLLNLDESYENVECYVHAASNNRLFHAKYYSVTSKVAGEDRVDLMIGSANATGAGIGLNLHPNIEVVAWGELTQADDIQNLSEITQYLCDGPNAIRLNSDEGREFVELYERDSYDGGGGHGGQAVQPDEPVVEPVVEPADEPADEPEQLNLAECSQMELMIALDNLVSDAVSNAEGTALERMHARRTGDDGQQNSGHYYFGSALASQFVIDLQPFDLLNYIRENTTEDMNWANFNLFPRIRQEFIEWLSNEDNWETEIYKVTTGNLDDNGDPIPYTVGNDRHKIAQSWGGSQPIPEGGNPSYGTTPTSVPRALYVIAWEIWDPEVNPAV